MKHPQLGDKIYYVCGKTYTIKVYNITSLELSNPVHHYNPHFKEYQSNNVTHNNLTLGFGDYWEKKPTMYFNRTSSTPKFGSSWDTILYTSQEKAVNRLKELKDRKIKSLQTEIDKLKL